MTIKQFAFDTQQQLQASTGSTFKRSHIYELLAAAFGFNSYAALATERVFTQNSITSRRPAKYGEQVGGRCLDLGYSPETALKVAQALPELLTKQDIGVIRIADLVVHLRFETGRLDYMARNEINDESMEDEEALYSRWFDPGSSPPAILVDGLSAAAERGDAMAHYALALIYAPSDDPFDEPSVGSEHWYNEEQNGRILSGVEKEWADEYAANLVREEKYVHHLRAAGKLGHEEALLEMAERLDDPTFFERPAALSPGIDPARVAEIAENLGRRKDAWLWLTEAAQRGDTEAMRELIEGYDRLNPQQCWSWVYLADLLGVDLFENEYEAINEDGSAYDDDVGGPLFVGGRGGIELEPIDAASDQAARLTAAKLYQAIETQDED